MQGKAFKFRLGGGTDNPILIQGESQFARLLVDDAHLQTKHGGKRDTLAQIRSKFWVTKAKKIVNEVIRQCTRCNRLEAKPFNFLEWAPLPDFRVRCSHLFENTGLDYLGPVFVRQVFDAYEKEFHKVEIVVYTVYVCCHKGSTS